MTGSVIRLKPFSFLLDQLNGFKPFIGADVPCVG